MFITVDVK